MLWVLSYPARPLCSCFHQQWKNNTELVPSISQRDTHRPLNCPKSIPLFLLTTVSQFQQHSRPAQRPGRLHSHSEINPRTGYAKSYRKSTLINNLQVKPAPMLTTCIYMTSISSAERVQSLSNRSISMVLQIHLETKIGFSWCRCLGVFVCWSVGV